MALPNLDLPDKELAYITALKDATQATLSHHVKAMYLLGSASYGAYEPGTSDLDVSIIVESSLPASVYQSLASVTSHALLPCPARKLELVVYAYENVKNPTRFPKFDMNFNTGADMEDHLVFDPSEEAGHWFLLDLAAGRELGVSLVGPAPKEVIGEFRREWIIDALDGGLSWWSEAANTNPDAVLNACRGWRWAESGVWGSKMDGALWVLEQRGEPFLIGVVTSAMQSRGTGGTLRGTDVLRVLDVVKTSLLRTAH